jgi:hypothetical protein
MRVRFVGADDWAWVAALEACEHDVHHRPAWALAASLVDDGEPRAAVVEEGGSIRCLIPLLVRQLDAGRWDAVSPYGYAGPVFPADLRPHERRDAVDAAALAMGGHGCVALFLRLHPVLDEGWSDGVDGVRDHGQTVSIDLSIDDVEFRRGLRTGHRGDIDRAIRDEVRVEFNLASDSAGAEAVARFRTLYDATMERVGADVSYRFPDAYYSQLLHGLGDDLMVVLARDLDDVPVAGALFTTEPSSGIAQYHLSGSAGGSGLQATKLLIATAREVLRGRGLDVLHLGGGRGAEEDSLYRFKAGFSGRRHRYRSLRRVLDQGEYERRCTAVGVDPRAGDGGHFPAYRNPH